MAAIKRRLALNAPGDFYVDSTCIDCGTCRWVAPASFAEARDTSFVRRQPGSAAEHQRARMALIACPTGSIGTTAPQDLTAARAAFPEPLDATVYHCGYHARASYGAASYLVVRPEGNVLVDSPRFTAPLVAQIAELGGISLMFLTHRDDVADHRRFAGHFGCRRIIHRDDVTADTAEVEIQITGRDPVPLADDLLALPVPGHTKGSACLLHADTHLFSGDHLAWDIGGERLCAFRDVCWYDWSEQRKSMARLAAHQFEWVLPGHGRRIHLPRETVAAKLRDCIAEMS